MPTHLGLGLGVRGYSSYVANNYMEFPRIPTTSIALLITMSPSMSNFCMFLAV